MTQRSDYKVQYAATPRQVTIDDPSEEFVAQDVIDTLAYEQALIDALDDDQLMVAAGGEELDATTNVGLTVTLQDTQIGFDMPPTANETGTATTTDTSGRYLDDSTALFQTNGVGAGDAIINFTTQAWGTVSRVISETRVETTLQRMVGGSGNGFTISDAYKIIPVKQCDVSGGNVVAVDSIGDAITSIFPTAFTQINRASSSSGTISDQLALQASLFRGKVCIDAINGTSGTAFPQGTLTHPVDNLADAKTIAVENGIDFLRILTDFTIADGENVDEYTLESLHEGHHILTLTSGCSTQGSHFTGLYITGAASGDATYTNCILNTLSGVEGLVKDCGLDDTVIIAGSSQTDFIDCYSKVPGTGTPSIDVDGSGRDFSLRGYKGGIQIENLSGTQNISIDLLSGHVILHTNVTAGTFVIRGVGHLTDNSTGTTIVKSGLVQGLDILRLLGLAQENQLTDLTTFDTETPPNMLTCRVRIFPSKTLADAATIDIADPPNESETEIYDMVSTYETGTNKLTSFKMVLRP